MSAILSLIVAFLFVIIAFILMIRGILTRQNLINQCRSLIINLKNKLNLEVRKIPENQIENINSFSLIEQVWSGNQELVNWEKQRRYYQGLPNLLLSIGLLGTFLGISVNLFLLSQNTSGEIEIQKALSDIIGSMAIAFGSSLAALLFSVILQRFFPAYILDISKDTLINNLEYYLDSEHLPKLIEKKTLKDKIDILIETIGEYSNNMNNLLVEFPETIERLHRASNVTADRLETSSEKFQSRVIQSSDSLQRSANTLETASQTLVSVTHEFSQMTRTLTESIDEIKQATQAINHSNNTLQASANQLQETQQSLRQQTSTIQEYITDNQRTFAKATNILSNTGNKLDLVSTDLQNNMSNLVSSVNQLEDTHQSLRQQASAIQEYIQDNQQVFTTATNILSHTGSQVNAVSNALQNNMSNFTASVNQQTSDFQNQMSQSVNQFAETLSRESTVMNNYCQSVQNLTRQMETQNRNLEKLIQKNRN